MICNYKKIDSIIDFRNRKDQIGVLERKVPNGSDSFFQKLYQFPFSVSGKVKKNNAKEDIKTLLKFQIPENIQYDPFYENWLIDMSKICKMFCKMQADSSISFWLGSQRGCKRFHVDMVPFRLLVTYAGKGTELLPNEAADRNAFLKGKSNKQIVKDKTAITYLNIWDISVFRGGYDGILHRTPDSALDGSSSILMRLDNKSFLEEIMKINGAA
tara:strand:- start:232 stop:873 length:642 start_codon:yes stop_codon:yes gene_type:complete